MKIKAGDKVIVTAGRELGMTGEVLRIDTDKDRVYVDGLNIVKRHKRPSPVDPEGGIVEKEAPIHASNVMLYSEQAERGVRVSYRYRGSDGELYTSRKAALDSFGEAPTTVQKVRFCAKTGETF